MADPALYTYPSPLEGYENLPPLTDEKVPSGPNHKALINPHLQSPPVLSTAYTSFPSPIDNGTRGGFDIHIYWLPSNPSEDKFATELHERIRREFPELRTYRLIPQPVGPHISAMFEVNLFTPQQFGAFIPWLVINRGPLSALIHPNTGHPLRDHTQRATWMGHPLPIQTWVFDEEKLKELAAKKERERAGV